MFEICGFGAQHDRRGSHVRSAGDGAAGTMKQALAEAGVSPADVACIVASASGSRMRTKWKRALCATVFGSRLEEFRSARRRRLRRSDGGRRRLLRAFGRACAGQGNGAADPRLGGCQRLESIASRAPMAGEYALINAFGCDGNNASLVIRLWKN